MGADFEQMMINKSMAANSKAKKKPNKSKPGKEEESKTPGFDNKTHIEVGKPMK